MSNLNEIAKFAEGLAGELRKVAEKGGADTDKLRAMRDDASELREHLDGAWCDAYDEEVGVVHDD